MGERTNVFAIHSWDDADACRRMEELLRASQPGLAHYTVLPERALDGTREEVAENLETRIRFASAVVVMNTPDLYRRPTASFEMQTAVRLGKRIVLVQPHGDFQLSVPKELDGHVYRFATWRSDVVGRAIRGEYPQDTRVFDLAEVAERRVLVGLLASGVAAVSFAVIVRAAGAFNALTRELGAAGVDLRWEGVDTGRVLEHALWGAAIGGIIGAVSGDGKTALYAAGAGAAVGAAVGAQRVYSARLLGTEHLRVLSVARHE